MKVASFDLICDLYPNKQLICMITPVFVLLCFIPGLTLDLIRVLHMWAKHAPTFKSQSWCWSPDPLVLACWLNTRREQNFKMLWGLSEWRMGTWCSAMKIDSKFMTSLQITQNFLRLISFRAVKYFMVF